MSILVYNFYDRYTPPAFIRRDVHDNEREHIDVRKIYETVDPFFDYLNDLKRAYGSRKNVIMMWGDDFTHSHAHLSMPVLYQSLEIYRKEAIKRNLDHEWEFKISTASAFVDATFTDEGSPETLPLNVEHADLWRYSHVGEEYSFWTGYFT